MIINLIRDYFTSYCTLGKLYDPVGGRNWQTIEKAWLPSSAAPCGVKGQSCIPLGTYRVERYSSDAHPNVFALSAPSLWVCVLETQVPPVQQPYARTRVLIHPANWASELRGCIAPGKSRIRGQNGIWQVTQSRDAMNEIRNLLGRSIEITLTITSGGITA